MSLTIDVLKRVPARPPRTVLGDLARADEPASVKLYLAAGHQVLGRLLRYDREPKEGDQVLLVGADGALIFVPVAAILAAEVQFPGPVAPLLSAGAIARPIGEAAPTALELRRRLAARAEALAPASLVIDWATLPAGDAARANVADLVEGVIATAETIRLDDMGREAWQAIGRVVLEPGTGRPLEVTRRGADLVVAIDLDRALPARLGERLAELMNAAL